MVAHGPPVGNAGAHVVERFGKALDQLLAVGIGVQTRDVEMDQAFALASCPLWQRLAVETQELALLVALHGNDRVGDQREDRKSTRLNSSHLVISYAVFC